MVVRAKAATGTLSGGFHSGKRSPRQAANVEVHIAIVKASTRLMDEFSAIVKPVDLSLSQYNVLRILRGAGPEGATCGEVVERLIQRDPDVTRLLDRLEKRGLIDRGRDLEDRRVVRTRITQTGLDLIASLDDTVNDLHHRLVGHLSDKQLADLRRLLEEISH
jgi:DNA-binding MarR family transcriptional regulator